MDVRQARSLLKELLREIQDPSGAARTLDFGGLRQVDGKIREGRMIIAQLPTFGDHLATQMDSDQAFAATSRRVRLEALANYCHTALRFLEAGVGNAEKWRLHKAPDVAPLTSVMPELKPIIEARWLEAQRCQHAGAYLAAVIMMGSILEALLLARAYASPAVANRAVSTPKDKAGRPRPIREWSLSSLIDVAAEVGWLKIDRKNFSHALRMSRNVVHPWEQVNVRADFDDATCDLSWRALRAAVNDLLASP